MTQAAPDETWQDLEANFVQRCDSVPGGPAAYEAACQTWALSPLLKSLRRPKLILQPRGAMFGRLPRSLLGSSQNYKPKALRAQAPKMLLLP